MLRRPRRADREPTGPGCGTGPCPGHGLPQH